MSLFLFSFKITYIIFFFSSMDTLEGNGVGLNWEIGTDV